MSGVAADRQPQRTEPRREADGKSHRPEALDGLFDAMSARYCRTLLQRGEMARRLNDAAIYPVVQPADMTEDVGVGEHVAALAASALAPAQKWGLQKMWSDDARLWSRLIGIMAQLPKAYINQLAGSGYVTDEYVENADHLLWSRISGLVLRWVMRRGASNESTLRKLIAGLELLQTDTNVEMVIGNDAQGNAYVRMHYGLMGIAQ